MKQQVTFTLDDDLIHTLKVNKVDNISDLVNTLLRAWVKFIQDKGGDIIKRTIDHTALVECLRQTYEEVKRDLGAL